MLLLISYKSILTHSLRSKEKSGEQPSTSNSVQHSPAPVPSTRVQDATGIINYDQAMANPEEQQVWLPSSREYFE
ncbi:hypothetical protein P691DRAFT_767738 [Macrolepiota fuliginosa MF-IS2]|uniref:Uncharacterized protein n=1 Tax=Macrolepiota fuliginosa MF-IS2 TaxID=1400762 RepID=A0A9P5WX25_9AGAR|nr:hypothetical protein P691DRAFT_767738 [Macrolepiota fuliginosa MF-IS2]